jgi:hypothetical protein
VVVPSQTKVQVLNPVGSKIYSMLDGRHDRAEIIRTVVDEFDVSPEQAERDLDAFLEDLRRENLLAAPDSPAGESAA